MQKASLSFIKILHYFLLALFWACSSFKPVPKKISEGELKDLYNDPYLVRVDGNSIFVAPTNSDWNGYGHVNTEAEKVSFLVRAALVEANNVCPSNKRSKILGKPKISRTGTENKQVISGAELTFQCKNR